MACCCGQRSKVDPQYEKEDLEGPLNRRQPTDVLFLGLFIAFFAVLMVMFAYAASEADLGRVINGYDNYGNVCGQQNKPIRDVPNSGADKTKEPYLYYSVFGNNQQGSSESSLTSAVLSMEDIYRECRSNCGNDKRVVLNRCIPMEIGDTEESFFRKMGLTNFFEEVSRDLDVTWREVAVMCFIAFGLSFVTILLLRFLAAVIVWLVLLAAVLASISATIYLWLTWFLLKRDVDEKGNTATAPERRNLRSTCGYAILATVVAIVVILIVVVLRKRVALVIQLFREAGKAIHDMPLLLLQPIWTLIALLILCGGFFCMCIYIESSGTVAKNTKSDNGYIYYKKSTFMKVARWYNVAALFWGSQFLIGCQHVTVAGAVSKWFFTRDKRRLGCPIARSLSRLLAFHLGSVALGSLLVAAVQFLRLIFRFVYRRFLSATSRQEATGYLAKCCSCCLCIVQNVLQFLNRNAYIEIAIYGFNFCKAAQKAFQVVMNNSMRVAAINSVGDFVLFMAKVAIVAITLLAGHQMLKNRSEIHHMWIPLALAGLFAYLISHCFLCVYEMAIDTIFVCFCEDVSQNDGVTRSYYMSKGLMEFVERSRMEVEGGRAKQLTPLRADQAWSSSSTTSAAVAAATALGMSTPGQQLTSSGGRGSIPPPKYYFSNLPPTPAKRSS